MNNNASDGTYACLTKYILSNRRYRHNFIPNMSSEMADIQRLRFVVVYFVMIDGCTRFVPKDRGQVLKPLANKWPH